MERKSWSGIFSFAFLFVGTLVIGLMIPTFYEWSGANQSRSSPEALRAFYVASGALLIALLALPWIPAPKNIEIECDHEPKLSPDPKPELNQRRFQFNVQTLLIATSLVALTIVGLRSCRLEFIVLVVCASLVCSMWMVAHRLCRRWHIASLVACMYLPWAWAFVHKDFRKDVDWNMLLSAVGLPSFVPSIFLARLMGQRVEDVPWILIVLTVLQLAFGIWMIRLGPRRTVAWWIVVFCCSMLGSMFLDAAIRI